MGTCAGVGGSRKRGYNRLLTIRYWTEEIEIVVGWADRTTDNENGRRFGLCFHKVQWEPAVGSFPQGGEAEFILQQDRSQPILHILFSCELSLNVHTPYD